MAVTLPDADGDDVPEVLENVYIGFTPGTGGAFAYHEIDDLEVSTFPGGGEIFKRGDADDDGQTNIADAILVLGFLFGGGPTPTCQDAADCNDDGSVNIADAIALLGHLFGGTGNLPAPFPGCGTDDKPDTLPPCVFTNCK